MNPHDSSDTAQQLVADAAALNRLARSLVARDDAEDLVQEAYAAALASDAARQHPGLWLRGAVRRLAAMRHRGNMRRRAREHAVAAAAIEARDPAALAMQAELVRDVGAAVHALEEPFRTAVLLRFWHGMSADAIAVQLGIPRNTARSRLQRGLERLRARLDRSYGTRERWAAPLGVLIEARAAATFAGGGMSWITGLLMQSKTIGAAAVVLFIAIAAGWLTRGDFAAPIPPPDHRPPAPTSGSGLSVLAGEPVQRVQAARLVRVVDKHGAALPGARVYRAASLQRLYALQELKLLGTTDAGGCMAMPSDLDGVVLAAKDGFQSADSALSRSADVTLALADAATLHVRCVMQDGQPLAGAHVLIASGPLDLERLGSWQPGIAGGNRLTAVHVAITDRNGDCDVQGIAPGAFERCVWHAHCVLAEPWPRSQGAARGELRPGANSTTLVWSPVYGVAARFHEPLIAWDLDIPRNLAVPPISTTDLQIRRQRLSADTKDSLCLLCCAKYDRASRQYVPVPATIPVRVLAARTGWTKIDLQVEPSARLSLQEIDLPLTVADARCGELLLRLMPDSGDAMPEVYVEPVGLPHAPQIDVTLGRPALLPPGSYTVHSPHTWVDEAWRGRRVDVVAGQQRELCVQLPQALLPIELQIADTTGLEHTSASLQFVSARGRSSVHVGWGLSRQRFWVPAGNLSITVTTTGCETTTLQAEVPSQPVHLPYRIEAVLPRRDG